MQKSTTNPRKAIYLLPNLFTTSSLFAGFYALISAINLSYEKATIAIFIALILDALDGRIARLTKTQTDFGAEYDSISDMVVFGVAPAILLYQWSLHSFGKVGMFIAFFYAATTGMRLARFNTQLDLIDNRYFKGLPCPSAAATLSGFVWFCSEYGYLGENVKVIVAILAIFVSVLMFSNVRYHSFKKISFTSKVDYFWGFVVIAAIGVIYFEPETSLFIIFLLYTLSGPAITAYKYKKSRKIKENKKEENKKEDSGKIVE
tara:strand:- start:6787 stop:7569 length:783 start_codon:yes stop_codon:yes gene_type:complete